MRVFAAIARRASALYRRRKGRGPPRARPVAVIPRALGVTEPIGAYAAGWLHPVHLGDYLDQRYKILRKLGHGRYATVWLAIDESPQKYVALKITAACCGDMARNEASMLFRLQQASRAAPALVMPMFGSFTHFGPNGQHIVLVLPPMGRTLADLIRARMFHRRTGIFELTTQNFRVMARQMALAVRHAHAHQIIHRDLHPGNFVFALKKTLDGTTECQLDQTLAEHGGDYIRYTEVERLTEGSIKGGRPMYMVEAMPLGDDARDLSCGQLVLSDFGSATSFSTANDSHIAYPLDVRTPEQLLGLPIDPSADVWALACVIFSMTILPGPFDVDAFVQGQEQTDEHLESMINVLGPMPQHLSQKWVSHGRYLDHEGHLLPSAAADPMSDSLNTQIMTHKPKTMTDEEAGMFEDFLRSVFQWDAAARPSIAELLHHPWLAAD